MDDQYALDIFFEVQRGLPRQGPGCDESTRKALALYSGLPARPAILDVGCGPGMQTIALAKASAGRITAVDTSAEYLDQLRARAAASGVAGRIEILAADMSDLRFAPASFDAIWALTTPSPPGSRFLKPGGFMAVTELVWLQADPPAEAAAFFADGYPAMRDVNAILKVMRACGYQTITHFTLPDRAWWEHYYSPLEAKLPALYEKYGDDDEALAIIKTTEREIEIRRLFPDAYGYEFFIGRVSAAP